MQVKGASKGVSPRKECSVFISYIDLECRLNNKTLESVFQLVRITPFGFQVVPEV